MFKSLRKAAISLGIKKDADEDAAAKKRMDDLKHAHDDLKKQVTSFLKTTADQGSHAASLHESMAKLYPAEQPLSAQVTSIAARSAAFREGSAEATAAMKESLEAALAAFLAKRNEVNKMVDERASVRQEIIHYQEKIAQLEPKAAANPKDAQKLDENKKKLEEYQTQFDELEEALNPELASLDGALAALVSEPFRAFLEKQGAHLRAQAEQYTEALAGAAAPAAAAPEAAPPAEAAAPPAEAAPEAATA